MKMFIRALLAILRKSEWSSLGKWLNNLWYIYSLKYYAVIQRKRVVYKYGCQKIPWFIIVWNTKNRGYRKGSKAKIRIIFFTFLLLNVYSQMQTENELNRHTSNRVLIIPGTLHKLSNAYIDMFPKIKSYRL